MHASFPSAAGRLPAGIEPEPPATVVVVGAGLVGTSIGLALSAQGLPVAVLDRDRAAVAVAVERGAGRAWTEGGPPADLAVIAVPPRAVPDVLFDVQRRGLARTYTDVADVKSELIEAVLRRGCDAASFVPAHPLGEAGGGGPDGASADLFRGKPWVLCADGRPGEDAVAAVAGLAVLCGAAPVVMDAESHDTAVALTSHSPLLISSALAVALADAGSALIEPATLLLAGRAVRDLTWLAAAEPAVCGDALGWNAKRVATFLSRVAADLFEVCAALALVADGDTAFMSRVTDLLERGQAGRRRLDAGRTEESGT